MDPFDKSHVPVVGKVEALAPGVRVVTAGNAGPMTFTGTRSYLVGERDLAVIDPGPDDPAHLSALIDAIAGKRVSAVVVTHAHLDHAPLARKLADEMGAQVFGFGPYQQQKLPAGLGEIGGGEGIDRSFSPDVLITDGDILEGDGWQLEAIHTPGHLGDHLCLAMGKALFSADHVMGWATTMISPPDGDLNAFMASLEKLIGRGEEVFYPGHGGPVTNPRDLMTHIKAHRLKREAEIVAALEQSPSDVAGLTASIYADIPVALHGAASRNVLAHLLALVERGEAGFEADASSLVFFKA